jgi:hypothetical protein
MNDTRDIGNRLAPFFRAHGFKRKNNKFFKIENNIALCTALERPGGLYSLCYILPLYIPTEIPHISYGGRLQRFKPFPVCNFDFYWNEPSKAEVFVEQTMECCEKYFFPLYESISTPEGLIDFLNKGFSYARMYFSNLRLVWYYELKIYTNFVLSRYDDMKDDISSILLKPEAYISQAEHDEWERKFDHLIELSVGPEEEKEAFVKNTIEHSMVACRFKK